LLLTATAGATNVTGGHYDGQNTGQDLTETSLTPATVSPATFEKRWTAPVDGYVYAQPLYLENVNITATTPAAVHNVVFVATEHDSIYALDGSNGTLLWHRSLLTNGLSGATSITTVPAADTKATDLVPEVGITGTPVLDATGGYLYVAAKSKQVVSSDPTEPRWVYTLFKLSVANGSIVASNSFAATWMTNNVYQFRTATSASAAQDPFVTGTGDGTIVVNGQHRVYFNVNRQMNRPGALLYDGNIYLGFGSHGDVSPYHGWLLSFNAGTLALDGVFNSTPNGGQGGIWQAGGRPAVDEQGYLYVMTGNGTFDGKPNGSGGTVGLNASGFPVAADYGDCFIKLALNPATTPASQGPNGWGLAVSDYFAPMENQMLSENDLDLGSGGPLVLPDAMGSSAHPYLLMGAGKEGKIYLLDRTNMGKYSPYTDSIVESQANLLPTCLSTPTYYNGNVYWAGATGYLQMFSISDASFSNQPAGRSPDVSNKYLNGSPTISANGYDNGVTWAVDYSSSELRAYNASEPVQELWTSDMAPAGRDQLGSAVKFSSPTVADGFVYVGATNALYAYSGPPPPSAAPTAPASLSGLALSGSEVILAWINNGALNSEGFVIEESTNRINYTQVATVGAIATEACITGLNPSTSYQFRVSYSPYSSVVGVTTVTGPQNLNFSQGFAGAGGLLNCVGSATITSGNLVQLTDGGIGESGAVWCTQPQSVSRFDTDFTFKITGNGNGLANGFTFCVQNTGPSQLGGGNGGSSLAYQGIGNSFAVIFNFYPSINTTALYTEGVFPNGLIPPAISMSGSGINMASGDVMNAHLTCLNGILTETVTDTVTNARFTHAYTVPIPALLGGTNAYVGFTGADGGQTAIEQIGAWTFTTLPVSTPAGPTGLTAAPASATQINLAWQDNEQNEDGFVVLRASGASWNPIGVTPSNTLTYSDTGLTPGTHGYYYVQAVNAVGGSPASNVADALTPTVPAPVANLQAAAVSATEVHLAWAPSGANATSFIVSRQQAGSGRHTVLANTTAQARSYVDATATAATNYTYYVQAANLAGPSTAASVTVTTP
jgi:hypothetical protein